MFEALGESPPYADPADDVVFGDIFEGSFFLDLFARADTALMGGDTVPAHLAPKLGKWMNTELPQEDLDLYSPKFTAKEADRFALAHATFLPDVETHRAVLLSDSCLTATALAQGRQKRSVGGRLLFAPVRVVDDAAWRALIEDPDFERFPLPPGERVADGSVAELRFCFMVEARVVKDHAGARLASLTPPVAEELEAHWNAYAARRGPRAYERNTLKLASLLAGGGQPGEDEQRIADSIADVLDRVWFLEGSDLEDVSDADEQVRHVGADASALVPGLTSQLAERLRELSELAARAADNLSSR